MLTKTVKILIADDHELFRKGIISLLLKEEKIKIVGEANDGKDLVYKCLKLNPDLLITDISMPEQSGIEAVGTLIKKNPKLKVIFLSMYSGEDYIYHCIKAGGSALLHKNISKEELLSVIEIVIDGNKYFGTEFSDEEIESLIRNYESNPNHIISTDIEYLTNKEINVLLLLADGLTNNEIAEKMYIGRRTVETHRANVMEKLNLKSSPQLIKYAIAFAEAYKKRAP